MARQPRGRATRRWRLQEEAEVVQALGLGLLQRRRPCLRMLMLMPMQVRVHPRQLMHLCMALASALPLLQVLQCPPPYQSLRQLRPAQGLQLQQEVVATQLAQQAKQGRAAGPAWAPTLRPAPARLSGQRLLALQPLPQLPADLQVQLRPRLPTCAARACLWDTCPREWRRDWHAWQPLMRTRQGQAVEELELQELVQLLLALELVAGMAGMAGTATATGIAAAAMAGVGGDAATRLASPVVLFHCCFVLR